MQLSLDVRAGRVVNVGHLVRVGCDVPQLVVANGGEVVAPTVVVLDIRPVVGGVDDAEGPPVVGRYSVDPPAVPVSGPVSQHALGM